MNNPVMIPPENNKKRRARLAVWFFMLAKRLFLKPGFVCLLLLIPLLGGFVTLFAEEESGITTVALAAEGGEDEISHEIVKSLSDGKSVVNFKVCDTAEEALELVKYSKAESAWIISAGLDEKIEQYAANIASHPTLAKIYQNEDTPILHIAREKLNGALFKYISRAVYHTFAKDAETLGVTVDAEEFNRYFDEAAFKDGIVDFEYLGASVAPDTETNYLVSPVRGMAALAALLCTLAASLYSMQEERDGFFSRIPVSKRLPIFFASNLAAAIASSLMVVLSLIVSGAATSFVGELRSAIALAVASASLATMLCRVFKSPFALGAATVPYVIAAAVLCPIFIGLNFPGRLDLLFPVTYAIRAVRAARYLGDAMIFSAICIAVAYVADRIKRRVN